MALPLRITHNNKDLFFELLTDKPSAASGHVEILLDGQTYRLRRQGKNWTIENDTHDLNPDLIQAIGKAMELRYRL